MTCTPGRHVHKLGTAGCECGEIPAEDRVGQLIRAWRRHADLSRRRFMEVERDEALELLDEIERLRGRR